MTDHEGAKRGYKVGFGKPPEETRFRKGQIGNPRGKAPGRKNLKTELLDELGRKIPVTENGKRRLMSPQTVIIKRLVADAAKGDPRAREQLLRLLEPIDCISPGKARANAPTGPLIDVEGEPHKFSWTEEQDKLLADLERAREEYEEACADQERERREHEELRADLERLKEEREKVCADLERAKEELASIRSSLPSTQIH